MRIFANLSPFTPQILAGAISSGAELMREVDRHGFDGIEVNLFCLTRPGGERLLEGLDYDRVSFHSNYLEFNPGASNPYIRDAAVRQLQDEIALASKRRCARPHVPPGSAGQEGEPRGVAREHGGFNPQRDRSLLRGCCFGASVLLRGEHGPEARQAVRSRGGARLCARAAARGRTDL